MENRKLISVVVPFYNIGNYVIKTIDSLESQTYRNFEVIFVDDASYDNSLNIVEEYLNKVSFKYKIIHLSKNKGVSNARNIGLDNSKGEYIYFLDSDDYISENTFEKIIEIFSCENPDIIFFKFKRVDENGTLIEHYNDKFKDVNRIENSKDILIKYLNLEIFIYTCSVIYKKEVINNFYFNEIEYIEDQDFIIRTLLNANRIGYIDSELVKYTCREGSIMNSGFNLKLLSKAKLFDTLYNQYKTSDNELSRLFAKRRAREILFITRTYIKNRLDLKIREINTFIKKNILSNEIVFYLDKKYLKELSKKDLIQILLLKHFPTLFIKIVAFYYNFIISKQLNYLKEKIRFHETHIIENKRNI
ncbi:glycosyltransferase family 2 protein [uncultured Ilyobacter sp.]|uniref:glycosyltransferase family 2 protein n=1 Tax=uncultured Ilyobacter sp. TaxID=544433 RepID=UPI0029F4C469|nr:glycosyltransferase family 2 protein [uncultured Ilyobacter sp.]